MYHNYLLYGNYTFSDNVVSVSRLRLITYPVRDIQKIILLDNVFEYYLRLSAQHTFMASKFINCTFLVLHS